jgi:prepilin-type N-terminal cleavage/methylation domain-containing protein
MRISRAVARKRDGFTFPEMIVAMVVMTLGLLALAAYMAGSLKVNRLSATRSEMTALAEGKLEELRAYGQTPSNDTLRLRLVTGGSTSSSVAGYSDISTGVSGRQYYRRWQMSDGVAGARRAAIAVLPTNPQTFLIKRLDFSTQIALRP